MFYLVLVKICTSPQVLPLRVWLLEDLEFEICLTSSNDYLKRDYEINKSFLERVKFQTKANSERLLK